jgi:hypothetical protein
MTNSKEQRAKSREQRAKSREQRAKEEGTMSKEQGVKSKGRLLFANRERTTIFAICYLLIAICLVRPVIEA